MHLCNQTFDYQVKLSECLLSWSLASTQPKAKKGIRELLKPIAEISPLCYNPLTWYLHNAFVMCVDLLTFFCCSVTVKSHVTMSIQVNLNLGSQAILTHVWLRKALHLTGSGVSTVLCVGNREQSLLPFIKWEENIGAVTGDGLRKVCNLTAADREISIS